MSADTVPFPADVHDLDASALFRILALRAFELSATDAGRQQVLGALLAAIEEDRLLVAQTAQDIRLARLQVHQLQEEMDLASVFESEPDDLEDDSPVVQLVMVREVSDEDGDDDEGEEQEA